MTFKKYGKNDGWLKVRAREEFYFLIPRKRVDELLFQEPTSKILAPNSKYNYFIT
jgi:hypothetical protein